MTPARRCHDRPVVCGVTLAAAIAGSVAAQSADDGPQIVGPRDDLEPLRFTDIDVALELEWRRDVDEVDPSGPGRRRTAQDRLREILDLRTEGFIGHPNLIELDLGGRVWLEQRWIDVTGDSDTQRIDQTLYEWDVNGLIFKESTVPLLLYSRQNISDIDRDFGGSLENTFTETGARLSFRSDVVPTNVHVFRREIDQKDRLRDQDFDLREDTVRADGRIEMGPVQRLAWDVEYRDIDESGDLRVTRSVHRFEGNATHALQFGEEEQNLLRTRVRVYDESGDQELRQIRVDPRLRLRHDENLQSWYDYSFARDDRPLQEQRSHRATANFQHDLFESVTTIGSAGFERFDVPTEDFDSDEIFGRVETEYRKQVPYGDLTLAVQGAASHLDQSDRGAPIVRSDQRFVFGPANSFVIEGRNIIVQTIVITDLAGLIVYTEGSDYIVRDFANGVEIQLIPGGDIAPGEAVRADYVVGPEPGGTIDTYGFGANFRYTIDEGFLEGLSFYVDYFGQRESRSDGDDDFPDDDFDDTRYGLEYYLGKIYLRAEGQTRTGDLSPFDAVRLEGRYVETLGPGSNVVLRALYQEVDRDRDDLRTTTTTFTGQWNQRIGDRMRVALILQYQQSDDNIGFDSDAFEQQFDIVWRRGQTEVYAQVRNSITNTNADDTTLQRFIVGLRREF